MFTTIFSTLRGVMAGKHPDTGVLVSVDGQVLILDRGKRWTNKNKTFHWSSGYPDSHGYMFVRIRKRNWWIHRLVAETFIPNPSGKPTVDHIDMDHTNNTVGNLRWATQQEQCRNTKSYYSATDYGVRKCDDRLEWDRRRQRIKRQQEKTCP